MSDEEVKGFSDQNSIDNNRVSGPAHDSTQNVRHVRVIRSVTGLWDYICKHYINGDQTPTSGMAPSDMQTGAHQYGVPPAGSRQGYMQQIMDMYKEIKPEYGPLIFFLMAMAIILITPLIFHVVFLPYSLICEMFTTEIVGPYGLPTGRVVASPMGKVMGIIAQVACFATVAFAAQTTDQ